MRAVVFTTDQIGYWFYIDSAGTFVYSNTTDGGATWGAAVTIASATTHVAYDVWFDQWTPGDSGTLIHTWYFDVTNDDVIWRSLDTSGDTLGTAVNVLAGASAVAGRGAFVSGTKTRSGFLFCAFDIDAGAERGLYRSSNSGTTWAIASSTFVEATLDEVMLFPSTNTGDDNDCFGVYLDSSASQLSLKVWDNASGIEVESPTLVPFIPNATDLTGQRGYSASIRHSDGHVICALVNDRDTVTADHAVVEMYNPAVFSPTVVTLTNITTNIDDHYYPAVFIDQFTDDIFVAYNGKRDGSEVLGTTTKVYYTTSTDDGATWSAGDTAYMEGATAAVFQIWAPMTGPRFYVGWRVGTTLLGNKVNSLTFAAAPPAAALPPPIRAYLQAVPRAATF